MRLTQLILGIICLGLAVVILLAADGPRRWLSGGFFLAVGIAAVVMAKRG